MECGGLVMKIPDGKKPAPRDRFDGLSHDHAVHPHIRGNRKVFSSELVFCGNVRFQRVDLRFKRNLLALSQVGERDQHVIFGIEFEDPI